MPFQVMFFRDIDTNQTIEKQFEKILREVSYSVQMQQEKYALIKKLLNQGVKPNIFFGKHALVFAAHKGIDFLKLVAKYMDPVELIKQKMDILKNLRDYLKIEVDASGNPKYSLALDIETNVKKAISYLTSPAFKPVGISMEVADNNNPELKEQFKKALSEPCFSLQMQQENYVLIKSLLDKGVNPNIFIGEHALELAARDNIELFELMIKHMDFDELAQEKNNIIESLENYLKIEVDETGNPKYSLPLDIETNVKEAIAYLKAKQL